MVKVAVCCILIVTTMLICEIYVLSKGEIRYDCKKGCFQISYTDAYFLANKLPFTIHNQVKGSLLVLKHFYFAVCDFLTILFTANPIPNVIQNTGAVHTLESLATPIIM